jgi:hypothetical protein
MDDHPGEVSRKYREKQTIIDNLYTYPYQLQQNPLPD